MQARLAPTSYHAMPTGHAISPGQAHFMRRGFTRYRHIRVTDLVCATRVYADGAGMCQQQDGESAVNMLAQRRLLSKVNCRAVLMDRGR